MLTKSTCNSQLLHFTDIDNDYTSPPPPAKKVLLARAMWDPLQEENGTLCWKNLEPFAGGMWGL